MDEEPKGWTDDLRNKCLKAINRQNKRVSIDPIIDPEDDAPVFMRQPIGQIIISVNKVDVR